MEKYKEENSDPSSRPVYPVQQVSESEEIFRVIFENNSAAIAVIEADTTISMVNDAYCQMCGYPREQVVGMSWTRMIPEEDLEDLKEYNHLRIKHPEKTPDKYEFRFYTRDGQLKYGLMSLSVIKSSNQIITSITDISEKKFAEEKILKTSRLYAVISQINQAIIHIRDKDELLNEVCRIVVEFGKFRMAWVGLVSEGSDIVKPIAIAGAENGYLSHIRDIKVSDVPEGRGPTGKAMREGVHVICNDIATDPILEPWREEAMKRGYRSSIALPLMNSGKSFGVFTLYSPQQGFFDQEEVRLLDEVAGDISFSLTTIETEMLQKKAENDLMEAENDLRESEEKYKTAFHTLPDAIIISKMDGTIVDVNPGFSAQSGFSKEESTGTNFLKLHIYSIPEERKSIIESLLSKGVVDQFETRIRCKDGKIKTVLISASVIRINNEHHILSITRDITDKKESEQELIRSKEKAEVASRLKTSLLLNMSHEIRTPLNGILGFAGILGDELTRPEHKRMAEIISLSGNRLMSTLNSILELSQVESDRKQLDLKRLDLGKLTAEIIDKNQKRFWKKNIETVSSFKEGLYITIDENLYTNILYHLVDNAVKFTEAGCVTIIVKKEIIEGQAFGVLMVTDTGIGISEDQLGYIFDAFRQGDEGYSRSFEGTGLGLTLCKKFTKLMGGDIEVKSRPGMGSTFSVRFPLTAETTSPVEQPSQDAILPDKDFGDRLPKVLIVEDNEANSDLIAIYLETQFITEQVGSGNLAVKMAVRESYDLILMDINLGPGINGIEAAKEIRKIKHYEDIPIISVTGYSTEAEKQDILKQGFNDFLPKPFDKASLLTIIKKNLQTIRKL